jgi:tetratricopeptide (TPR) repeat protein
MKITFKELCASITCTAARKRLGSAVLLFAGALLAMPLFADSRRGMRADELGRLFEAGQYQKVQEVSEHALAAAPRDAALHYWLARSSYELGKFDLAVHAAEEACKLEPANSEYQMWLGRAYGRKAEIESSFFLARKTHRAFEAAVRLDPSNIPARRNLSEYYTEAPWFLGGGKDKARQQVEAIAALDPLEGLLALADFYRSADQPQEAGKQFEILLEKRPPKLNYYIEALDFYMSQKDAMNMARVLATAQSIGPQDVRLQYFRAISRVIGGLQLDQAEKELSRFLAEYPGNSESVTLGEAHEWLGLVYEREGNWPSAAEHYRNAVDLEPYRKRFRKSLERAEKEFRKQKK